MSGVAELDVDSTLAALENRIGRILEEAKRQGATSAEVGVSEELGLSVSVRQRELETVEFNRDKGFGITVYVGKKKGNASTSDSSEQAIIDTVAAACNIAKFTAADEHSGLADAELMATEFPDLDLNHPWAVTPELAESIGLECEAAALAHADVTNSEGATVSTYQGIRLYANSHGFVGRHFGTRHSLSCSVVAGTGDAMQRDYHYTTDRRAENLIAAATVGRTAADRAAARLGAGPVPTAQVPVLFSPEVASSLISHFMGAISGGSLYRRSSFLLDCLGEQIFPAHITIDERPLLPGLQGSAAFDGDGLATRPKSFIADGVLQHYMLGTYSARRLGLASTANAGGAHNLFVSNGEQTFDDLVRQMHRGLVVTQLMGQGVNGVTGDYSRGASGFWVDDGALGQPVDNITIAGNLRDMFKHVVAVGADVDHRGNLHTGSILIEEMTVAGS